MSSKKILLVGPANSGKSTSLRNLRERQAFAYLNTDLKPLPFSGADAFLRNIKLNDPKEILSYLTQLEESDKCQGVILDTLSFLMQVYERKFVTPHPNTQKAWGEYANFYREFIELIKLSEKPQIVMCHTSTEYDETSLSNVTKGLVKGQVGRLGIDSDFSVVVTARQMQVKALTKYEDCELLTITDRERELGLKYVFSTQLLGEQRGELTRAPMGFWKDDEIYIDNDIQIVLDRMSEYYDE